MFKRAIIFLTLFVVSNTLFAQFHQLNPAIQPEMAWKDRNVVLSYHNYFEVFNPDKSAAITIQVPPNTIDNRFAQDYFWVVQDDPSSNRLRICRSEDGKNWEYVASWHTDNNMVGNGIRRRFYLHPLAEDTFLLVCNANSKWFKINGVPCPIVIAKVNSKKELKITRAVDLGLHEQLGWIKNGEFVFNEHYFWFLSCTINRPFLTVGDKVFLAFRRIGTFIEIRPNGNLGKIFRVIPGLDEKATADPDSYDWAVLCAQPTMNNDILVLARSSDGVLEGRKRFPRIYSLESMQNKISRDANNTADESALKAYPEMDWWMLDPENGNTYRSASPQNVPTFFTSIQEFSKFVFYINPKGNLVFPLLNR